MCMKFNKGKVNGKEKSTMTSLDCTIYRQLCASFDVCWATTRIALLFVLYSPL